MDIGVSCFVDKISHIFGRWGSRCYKNFNQLVGQLDRVPGTVFLSNDVRG